MAQRNEGRQTDSLRRFGRFVAGSPLAQAQGEPGGGAPPSDRLAPVLELVNVPEFEAMAGSCCRATVSRPFAAASARRSTG